jgi:hypothetical protein
VRTKVQPTQLSPESKWHRAFGIIWMIILAPVAIPFLLITGIGDALLSPFYPNRGPYSGPPFIFRAFVGMLVAAALYLAVLALIRQHKRTSRSSHEFPTSEIIQVV